MARWVYGDASALIKRYAPESGTALVNAVFDRAYPERMTCATLGLLEVVSILTRKRNDGRLTPAAYDQALIEVRAELIERQDFRLSPINDALLVEALTLITQHNINAADALILRSALEVQQAARTSGDEVVLWSADKRLVRAAQREGLATFDPETDTLDDFQTLFGET